jgi:protein ATS1
MPTKLYALGSNSAGQLGIGHHEDVDVPTACEFILTPSLYTGITDTDNSGDEVKLGISRDLGCHIRKIVAGGNHTMVLCDNGELYAAGSYEALGEIADLGLQHPGLGELRFRDLAPYFKRVMWREESQLLDSFSDVSATWSASFLVAAPQVQDGYTVDFGRIYACGKGEKGELGLGNNVVDTIKPRQVAVFSCTDYPGSTSKDLVEVSPISGMLARIWSSMGHTVTCSKNGLHVFGWGNCRKGQLGDSLKESKVLWKPTKIADKDIKEDVEMDSILLAAVGRDFTLLQGTDGKQENRVEKWRLLGGNTLLKSDGDDLRDFFAKLTTPVSQGEMAWLETVPFASWSSVYILDGRAQKVKALGKNDHGQLPPEELPEIWTMAAGSEHCVALVSRGRAVTWGWGEHGNCGREGDETGQGWSVLNLPMAHSEKVAGVGAGCATTFIWTLSK